MRFSAWRGPPGAPKKEAPNHTFVVDSRYDAALPYVREAVAKVQASELETPLPIAKDER